MFLGVVLCFLMGSIANASTIDTTGEIHISVGPFGERNTATFGQTFTVGADNQFNSFSFWLSDNIGAPVDFAAYVYKWDGTKATGANLYTSNAQHFSGSNNLQFAFSTGGVQLDAGSQYVAFLSASNYFNGTDGVAFMRIGSDYLGGDFVYYNNGGDFSALTNHSWDVTGGFGDVWFKADFSQGSAPVPEPGTIVLLSLGMAGLALYGKRHQNN